jgi:hypothetical protein
MLQLAAIAAVADSSSTLLEQVHQVQCSCICGMLWEAGSFYFPCLAPPHVHQLWPSTSMLNGQYHPGQS